jgi:diguanylate cyclase (GGDEF)-like protein/PAS domain S-box-containing protein
LADLQDHAVEADPPSADRVERLARARLGVASSLFIALRAKHAPTAAHCLRVALTVSAWGQRLGLSSAERDRIEIAALLHDVGKIGVPDRLLRKPARLTDYEREEMDARVRWGSNILEGFCSDHELLEIVRHTSTWFKDQPENGRQPGQPAAQPRELRLPLGSRLIAIVDAFDSMTSDQVYRRALSREAALRELWAAAGTQFDGELVKDFCRLMEQSPELMHHSNGRCWLEELPQGAPRLGWGSQGDAAAPKRGSADRTAHPIYQDQLLSLLPDGVLVLDAERNIVEWNPAMQRLTGLPIETVLNQRWSPELVYLMEPGGRRLVDQEDPLLHAFRRIEQMELAMQLCHRDGGKINVQLLIEPILTSPGERCGVIAIFRDHSERTTLEARVAALHRQVTRDPLTGIANRSEFDRRLYEITTLSEENQFCCSLIICDVDHFKSINDRYGHPAGDQALRVFSQMLKQFSRGDDLVARYGGEEFVLLCPGLDNATAARRAEEIRRKLESTPLEVIACRALTASFGVTELQAGDSAETFLARADRALLTAKNHGRNRVVQLGTGSGFDDATSWQHARRGLLSWLKPTGRERQLELRMVTHVPVDLAVEKLRGFISDHRAEVLRVGLNDVEVRLTARGVRGRRSSDMEQPFRLHVQLMEDRAPTRGRDDPRGGADPRGANRTIVDVRLMAIGRPGRRHADVNGLAENIAKSLKSYLMARLIDIQQPLTESSALDLTRE